MTMGCAAQAALTARRPPTQRRHAGAGPSLVQKHQMARIQPGLSLLPVTACLAHILTLLLADVQGFF